MNCGADDELEAAIHQLVEEMHATHCAVLQFDGARFAKHVENEIRLTAALLEHSHARALPLALVNRVHRMMKTRRSLLRDTKRTVNALLGLLQTSRATYELTNR